MKIKFAILCFIALGLSAGSIRAQEETVVDQVVAVAGKNIVKLSDIENSYSQLRRQQGNVNAKENRCNILESILVSKLLIHKGEVDSVEVTDEEVEDQVQYYLKAVTRQYGTKEAMRQATGYTYDEFHDIYFGLIKDRIPARAVQPHGERKNHTSRSECLLQQHPQGQPPHHARGVRNFRDCHQTGHYGG